jgi:hypothetical protein
LWHDEGTTAYIASLSTFSKLEDDFVNRNTSEKLMPGYVLYMWTWEKLFGHSERSLRLANLLPFLASIYILLSIIRQSKFKNEYIYLLFLILFSPFLVFNTNEARVTLSIFSFTLISLCGWISIYNLHNVKKGLLLISIGLCLGITFNILFCFLIPIIIILFLRLEKRFYKDYSKDIITCGLIIFIWYSALGIYYLYALNQGAGGRHEVPGIGNIGFALYEFLGFAGLGPSRNDLRLTESVGTIIPYLKYIFPLLFTYSLFMLILLYKQGLKKLTSDIYLQSFFVGFIVFFAFAFAFNFRFWGRHVIIFYPIFLFWLACNFKIMENFLAGKLSIVLIFICLLISSYNLKYVEYYQKENVKLAAEKALFYSENKFPIIWSWSENLANYYGLYFEGRDATVFGIRKRFAISLNELLNNEKIDVKNAIFVWNKKAAQYDKYGEIKNKISYYSISELYASKDFRIIQLNQK